MNEQQPQSNFEAMPGRKRMPLAQSLIFGRHSHYLPAILCLLYPVLAAIVHLPKVPLILAWLVIVLIWLTLRFGYQLLITRWIYQHNYVAAVRIGLFLMVVFPEDSYLLVNLANAFYGLGELEKADELADKAIFLGERLPLAYLIRTKVLVSIELQEESSEVDLIESTSTPKQVDAFLKMKEEKYLVLEEMERFFRTPNLAPPFLYISLAYYLAKLGDLDSAQEALAKAEDSKQKHAQAYWFSNQARIHLLKGDPTAALEASTRAVELSNQQADILATHGLMLLRNGELQKAKEQLDAAISIEGKNTRNAAEISYFRAELFEKNGDKQSAEEDLKYAKWNGYIPYL